MATPSYWATDFIVATTAPMNDFTDWITAIRTALTVTLPVASRWTESPANTFNSPANPVSGNFMRMVLLRNAANSLQFTFSAVVGGVSSGTILTGQCFLSVANTPAIIYAGPTHFWTNLTPNDDYAGCVIVDPTPEPAGLVAAPVFARVARNAGTNPLDAHADFWAGVDPNGNTVAVTKARAQGPFYPVDANTCQLITAGGSYVFFPVVGVVYPTGGSDANQRTVGTFPQFVWVDPSFSPGSYVSVPIDVGVIGIFQVLTSKVTTANGTRGAVLAVRAG